MRTQHNNSSGTKLHACEWRPRLHGRRSSSLSAKLLGSTPPFPQLFTHPSLLGVARQVWSDFGQGGLLLLPMLNPQSQDFFEDRLADNQSAALQGRSCRLVIGMALVSQHNASHRRTTAQRYRQTLGGFINSGIFSSSLAAPPQPVRMHRWHFEVCACAQESVAKESLLLDTTGD